MDVLFTSEMCRKYYTHTLDMHIHLNKKSVVALLSYRFPLSPHFAKHKSVTHALSLHNWHFVVATDTDAAGVVVTVQWTFGHHTYTHTHTHTEKH